MAAMLLEQVPAQAGRGLTHSFTICQWRCQLAQPTLYVHRGTFLSFYTSDQPG